MKKIIVLDTPRPDCRMASYLEAVKLRESTKRNLVLRTNCADPERQSDATEVTHNRSIEIRTSKGAISQSHKLFQPFVQRFPRFSIGH